MVLGPALPPHRSNQNEKKISISPSTSKLTENYELENKEEPEEKPSDLELKTIGPALPPHLQKKQGNYLIKSNLTHLFKCNLLKIESFFVSIKSRFHFWGGYDFTKILYLKLIL